MYSKYSVNGILFDVPVGVKYFKFIPSNECNAVVSKDLIIFSYIQGYTASQFCDIVGFEAIYPENVIVPYLRPYEIKFEEFNVNRDSEFIKICHENINLTQLKYRVAEDAFINRYYNLIYLIGVDGVGDLDLYYSKFEDTKLLKVNNRVGAYSELNNVEIHNSRVNKIKSSRVYLPSSKYRQYRISSLDYLVDFIGKMAEIFEEYGFELVEYQKLQDVTTHNVVTFRIGSHTKEFLKKIHVRIPEHNIMHSGSRVQFILSTPDTDIYEDFKMRYNNIDLIQNNREFKCEDKYGELWRYSCVWQGSVDESFAHEFNNTEFGTHGYQFSFSATLEFFDVYDVNYKLLEEILINYKITGPEEFKQYESET